jgi:hypothetical protein
MLLNFLKGKMFWNYAVLGDVQVSVAKNFDAPIKLLFPRSVGAGVEKPFSMLGLGDIVIPGVFVALLLRYDTLNNFKTMYFYRWPPPPPPLSLESTSITRRSI